MKRVKPIFLILIVIMLCACAVQKETDAGQNGDFIISGPAQPIYVFEDTVQAKSFQTEDGKVFASYNYQVPMMSLGNGDKLSLQEREIAERNVAAFNEQMRKILNEAVEYGEELGEESYEGFNSGYMPLADEKVLSVFRRGEVLTVLAQCYYYGGGAHPYTYSLSYIFDLTQGQFIDPAQIGDDPEAFRVQTAQLLVEHAEALGEEYTAGFWPNYAEIISGWTEAAVVFERDGMKVIFSVYELGPYAMGPVELLLTYEELSDAIGEGGLTHLGVEFPK